MCRLFEVPQTPAFLLLCQLPGLGPFIRGANHWNPRLHIFHTYHFTTRVHLILESLTFFILCCCLICLNSTQWLVYNILTIHACLCFSDNIFLFKLDLTCGKISNDKSNLKLSSLLQKCLKILKRNPRHITILRMDGALHCVLLQEIGHPWIPQKDSVTSLLVVF